MSNEQDSAAIRELKREYHRKWREQHPEQVRAAQERYWRKKLKESKSKDPGIPGDAEIR